MTILHYVDLTHSRFNNIPQDKSNIFRLLHGIFKSDNHLYNVFGLAFIKNGVRVFCEDIGGLEDLWTELKNNDSVKESFYLDRPNSVNLSKYIGGWISHSRFSIPTRKQDRHPTGPLRRKRLLEADENPNISYVNVGSKSQQTHFRYYVNHQFHNDWNYESGWETNGYGLSSSTRLVAFPYSIGREYPIYE
jgi:hypothetical protein